MTLAFCLVAKRAPIADAAGSITNTSVVLGTTTAGAVTTARGVSGTADEPVVDDPIRPAGALYRVKEGHLGIRGIAEPRSKARLPQA